MDQIDNIVNKQVEDSQSPQIVLNQDMEVDQVPQSSPLSLGGGELLQEDEVSILSDEVVENDRPQEKAHSEERLTRRGLSGAARKRLKWLLARGHKYEEARVMALAPLDQGVVAKRPRSDGSTSENPHQKRVKIAEGKGKGGEPTADKGAATTTPTYREILDGIRVGILPSKFPEETVSVDQVTLIRRAILDRILKLGEGDIKPKFLSFNQKPGWLLLTCEDKDTLQWLKDIVGELKPWEGADLRAVEEEHIPRTKVFVGYFPNSLTEETTQILGYIKAQNSGLQVDDWKVLGRTEEGSVVRLVLSVDHKSALRLEKAAYKASYQFGKVRLAPRGGTNSGAPPTAKAAPTSAGKTEPRPGPSGISGKEAKSAGQKGATPTGALPKEQGKVANITPHIPVAGAAPTPAGRAEPQPGPSGLAGKGAKAAGGRGANPVVAPPLGKGKAASKTPHPSKRAVQPKRDTKKDPSGRAEPPTKKVGGLKKHFNKK